ncbi:glycoside hydrolase superfamily [Penicillium mononematosum]|uniref:glycoside hydrolase superfamily n=1 Tax=Penicillium mononematosum TaxID=268346 RepID=UPI00254725B8|nr:glycoside hydrolase superfamily [Penicillium mononematosum]KAJ6187818.1 glycoside hydrolase superfamily [Penicillium mononematosum]
MVIHLGGPKFLLIGWGFQVREHTLSPKLHLHRVVAFRREDDRSQLLQETSELRTADLEQR